jgi:hypothetical protein
VHILVGSDWGVSADDEYTECRAEAPHSQFVIRA